MLYQTDDYEEQDFLDALQEASEKYLPRTSTSTCSRQHVAHDVDVLEAVLEKVSRLHQNTMQSSRSCLTCCRRRRSNRGKRLIFTQYSRHG
jgi:hypothetical protein